MSAPGTTQCEAPTETHTLDSADCDDSKAEINPLSVWFPDSDGDTYGDMSDAGTTQCEKPSDTHTLDNADCDDSEAAINPLSVWFPDGDDDGYGSGEGTVGCEAPGEAYALLDGDCNESDATLNPATPWYPDSDGDEYGADAGPVVTQCEAPEGAYLREAGDCDDTKAEVNPTLIWYDDKDEDGFGNALDMGTTSCLSPLGPHVFDKSDCDDDNFYINPMTTWYGDGDEDGFGVPDVVSEVTGCIPPEEDGWAPRDDDCDDTDPTAKPGAMWWPDGDQDGFGPYDISGIPSCLPAAPGYAPAGGDCDDDDPEIYPASSLYAAYTSFEEPESYGGDYTDVTCIDPETGLACNPAEDPHMLINNPGEKVVQWTPTGFELGFDIHIDPEGSAGGFADGDLIGVTRHSGVVSSFPDGKQGLRLEDPDGVVTLTFETAVLTAYSQSDVALDVFLDDTGWEDSDWLYVWVETEDQTIVLLDTQGQDIDDLGLEEMWTTLSADLGASDEATVKLQFKSNAGSERVLIDFVRISGTCIE